jgi:site-specific DNA recombinase
MQQLLRVAIYARVSSEHQAGEDTIASQIAALEARVSADGLVVPAAQRFADDGFSGATLARPALEQLRDLAAAGGLDRVYVHAPDRLARRYAYQVLLVDELRRAGVEIMFLNRPIGTSAEDDLLLQVQGMVAEYEQAKILERSRRGKRHAALAGSVNVFGKAPYGYRYVSKRDGGGVARFEIVEEQAQVVRQIFEWVARDRLGTREVCRRLHRQKCSTCEGKPIWNRATVWRLLKNPAYRGEAAFGKSRPEPRSPRLRPMRGRAEQPRRARKQVGMPAAEWIRVPVPPIVDPVVFDAVQEQLCENRRRSREHADGARHLLQGLLVCGSCGYAYCGTCSSARSAGGELRHYTYYRCSGSDARGPDGQRACANTQLRVDVLDAAVWREVEHVLRDPARIALEYERRLEAARRGGAGGLDLAAVEMQLSKLRRGMGRLIDGYAEGLIERAEFEPRMAGFRQRIQAWEAQARTLRDDAAQRHTLSLLIGRLEDFARRVHEGMSDVDWHKRRELIRLVVKRVEIDHAHINVVLRIDPLPSRSGSPDAETFSQDCRGRAGARACPPDRGRHADRSDGRPRPGVAVRGSLAAVSPGADPGAPGDRDQPRGPRRLARHGNPRDRTRGAAPARDSARLGAAVRRRDHDTVGEVPSSHACGGNHEPSSGADW